MVRAVSALTGAILGFAIGAALRPTVFGAPIPFLIVFSKEPMDAPFREIMIQNVSFSILAGAAVAVMVIPLVVRAVAGRNLADVRFLGRHFVSRRPGRGGLHQ